MANVKLRLAVENLHWIGYTGTAQDLCAHGDVVLEIAGESAWKDGADDLCVSAAAMNLLRTLETDHVSGDDPLAFNLFPHCGHVWAMTDEYGLVNITDCPAGRDVSVEHGDGFVRITSPSGTSTQVPQKEWAEQVCAFADAVEEFYHKSEVKEVHKDDKEWYGPFWKEWRAQRARYI